MTAPTPVVHWDMQTQTCLKGSPLDLPIPLQNNPSIVPSDVGDALALNGVDQAAALKTSTALNNASMSMGVWLKRDADGSELNPWVMSLSANVIIYITASDNRIRFVTKKAVSSDWQAAKSAPQAAPPDTWLHVLGTFDDTTKTSKIYVNGILAGTLTNAESIGFTRGEEVVLGSRRGVDRFFKGQIAHAQVYDYVLSEGEILEAYAEHAPISVPPPVPQFDFPQGVLDHASNFATPAEDSGWALVGGSKYSTLPAAIQMLCVIAKNDPEARDSQNRLIVERAAAQLIGAVTPGKNHRFRGGHNAWHDMHIPLSLAIAKKTPAIWDRFNTIDKSRADLIMEHCLYAGALFCNTNDRPGLSSGEAGRSLNFLCMEGLYTGGQPNQSGPNHGFLIGALSYWGSLEVVNTMLDTFDRLDFIERLETAGFDTVNENVPTLLTIPEHYTIQATIDLLNGIDVPGHGRIDPQGIRKPLTHINTNYHRGTPAGLESPYHGNYERVETSIMNVFIRWTQFLCDCAPKSNVGPSEEYDCNGIDFGTADGSQLPYEGTGLNGMPYEFNARSGNASGRPTRSSYHYVSGGVFLWLNMFTAVVALGEVDTQNQEHVDILDLASRMIEIYQYVGNVSKWIGNSGPAQEQCTSNHGDANSSYYSFPQMYMLHSAMMEGLFSS